MNCVCDICRDRNASESEAELDGDENTVILPQDVAGRGNIKSAKSGIRLINICINFLFNPGIIVSVIYSGQILDSGNKL